MYSDIKSGFEEELDEIHTEMGHLLPTVLAAFKCYRHGWINKDARDFWEEKFLELHRRYHNLQQPEYSVRREIVCEWRDRIWQQHS